MTILDDLLQHAKPCWIGTPKGPHYLCAAVYAIEAINNRTFIRIANGAGTDQFPITRTIDVPLDQITYVAKTPQVDTSA
jgi:hypothetical protein